MTATESTGFIGWTATYGQIIGFYIQLFYYILLPVAAIWGAKTFARYVTYMTTEEVEVEVDESEDVDEADMSESAESDEDESAESDKKKSVDEFVE